MSTLIKRSIFSHSQNRQILLDKYNDQASNNQDDNIHNKNRKTASQQFRDVFEDDVYVQPQQQHELQDEFPDISNDDYSDEPYVDTDEPLELDKDVEYNPHDVEYEQLSQENVSTIITSHDVSTNTSQQADASITTSQDVSTNTSQEISRTINTNVNTSQDVNTNNEQPVRALRKRKKRPQYKDIDDRDLDKPMYRTVSDEPPKKKRKTKIAVKAPKPKRVFDDISSTSNLSETS